MPDHASTGKLTFYANLLFRPRYGRVILRESRPIFASVVTKLGLKIARAMQNANDAEYVGLDLEENDVVAVCVGSNAVTKFLALAIALRVDRDALVWCFAIRGHDPRVDLCDWQGTTTRHSGALVRRSNAARRAKTPWIGSIDCEAPH